MKDKENLADQSKFDGKKALLQDENDILKKKIMGIKNDINMIKVKKGELDFYIENQVQDRLVDIK